MKAIILVFLTALFINAQTDQWRLIWNENDPGDNVTAYKIYKDTHPGATTWIHSQLDTVYIDSDLQKGVLIYYRLKAENDYGESDFSNEVSGSIPLIEPIGELVLETVSTQFNLNDLVYDPGYGDNLLLWTFSGNQTLQISIEAGIMTVSWPVGWYGSESILLRAENPLEMYDEITAVFTVEKSLPGVPTLRLEKSE